MRMKGFILSFSQSIEKKLLRFSSSPPAPTSNEKNLRCVVMIVSSRQKGMKAIERRSGVVKNERKGITKAFLSVEQVGKKGGGGSLSSELTNTKKVFPFQRHPSFDSSASCSFFHPSARIHPPFSSSLSTLSLLCCCYCSRSFLFSGSLHSLTWNRMECENLYTFCAANQIYSRLLLAAEAQKKG